MAHLDNLQFVKMSLPKHLQFEHKTWRLANRYRTRTPCTFSRQHLLWFWFWWKIIDTEIYIKETDSRSYLNLKSCHPRFIFSSIIWSQALQNRQIIIKKDLLNIWLMELYRNFRLSDYPHTMINNILEKVIELPRILVHNQQSEQTNEEVVRLITISLYGQS